MSSGEAMVGAPRRRAPTAPSIIASPTISTVPTAWKRRDATSASAAVARLPRHMALAPCPIAAGVLGITRTMRHAPPAPSIADSCATEMPAATEMMSVDGRRAAAMDATADAITYGFTARMSTSACRATSALSRVQLTPVSATARRGSHWLYTNPSRSDAVSSRPAVS